MKFHITNLYNFNPADELVIKQHRFADAARELGFNEMGLFSYPVETDTASELSKRLDGIISSLEPEDVVFIQLPTGNGYTYENLLFHKIKAYANTKIVLIPHNLQMISDSSNQKKSNYISLFEQADRIIIPVSSAGVLQSYDLTNLLFYNEPVLKDTTITLGKTQFFLKKIFMDTLENLFYNTSQQMLNGHVNCDSIIQIGFGLHDKTENYSMWVGTAMLSTIEHTESKICFHILHDKTLSTTNKQKLSHIAISHGHLIEFHLLDNSIFDSLIEQTSYFTIGTMFRIMLPELLPQLDKILYLDADILVNRDIKELWDIDISQSALAAVPDFGSTHGYASPLPVKMQEVSAERYFNAGVLSVNLSYFRKHRNMKKEVMNYLKNNPEASFPDQDALNSLYNNDTLLIDSSWNYFARRVQENKEKELSQKIYHYAATRIKLYSQTKMDSLYFETLCRTPWGKEEGPKILSRSINRILERTTQLEKVLHETSSTPKKKIFYGSETSAMKNIYQLVSVQEGDIRILNMPVEDTNCILPCQPLSVLDTKDKEDIIIFVLPEADNWTSVSNLEKMGFENEKDFFIIPVLLPPERGGYV